MHFNIDSNNKIISFHIERLEEPFIGKKLVNKINSYNGKKLEDFLKFALKERLFFKVPILNVYGKTMLTLWAIPAREGEDGVNNMIKTISSFGVKNFAYAEIHLNAKGSTLVLMEKYLGVAYKRLGFPVEIIELSMPPKDVKEIAKDFNIARNSHNAVYILVPGKGYAIMNFKGVMFMCSGEKGLEIFNKKELLSLPKSRLLKFNSCSFTIPSTEDEKKDIDEVTKFIMKNKK
jgi:hypothetical protein